MNARRFPLDPAPICPTCDNSCIRSVTSPSSRSGNAGRPYYFCDHGHQRIFVTWDDARGISPDNPRCRCGVNSRRDRKNGPVVREFYTCATKECGFWEDIDPEEQTHQPRSNSTSPSYTPQPQRRTYTGEVSPSPAPRATAAAPKMTVPGTKHDTGSDASSLSQGLNQLKLRELEEYVKEEAVRATRRELFSIRVANCPAHRGGLRSMFRRCICRFWRAQLASCLRICDGKQWTSCPDPRLEDKSKKNTWVTLYFLKVRAPVAMDFFRGLCEGYFRRNEVSSRD